MTNWIRTILIQRHHTQDIHPADNNIIQCTWYNAVSLIMAFMWDTSYYNSFS